MCTSCHNAQHSGDKWVIERLIDRAPGYWRSVGEWEMNVEAYERWCSKRRFQRVFDWVR